MKDPKKVAEQVRAGGMPDSLNHWLPETQARIEAARKAGLDFTAHGHPVRAVACPSCKAGVGKDCIRPSGHPAGDFHADRKAAADAAWEAAQLPTISQTGPKTYVYDAEEPKEGEVAKIGPKEAQTRAFRAGTVSSETLRETGSLSARVNLDAEEAKRAAAGKPVRKARAAAAAKATKLLEGAYSRAGKKTAARLAEIAEAVKAATGFALTLYHEGSFIRAEAPTLEAAFAKAEEMERDTKTNRRAIVNAVQGDGRLIPVPRSFKQAPATQPPAKPEQKEDDVTTKSTERRKPAKAKKTAKKARSAARKPAAKNAAAKKETKSDVVDRMLKRENGASREELSKATGWPNVNLKVAAARAEGFELKESDGRFRLVAKAAA